MKIRHIDQNYITESPWDAVKGAAGRAVGRAGAAAASKLGNRQAQGVQQRQKLQRAMHTAYNKWLGQSGQKATVGSMYNYLTQVGVDAQIAQDAIGQGDLSESETQGNTRTQALLKQPLDRNQQFEIFKGVMDLSVQRGKIPPSFRKYLKPGI